jgi:predicted RND superfamily exporter protein
MTEAIVLCAGILIGGLGIAYGLQVRHEFHERDKLRRFQEAMRAAGRPSTQKRRD